jgi:hypothetical protein
MMHARLPGTLWPLAKKQAAFIFNRVAHNGALKTPYELCLGVQSSWDMVRVFGCQAYMHNINYPKQFVNRAKSMVHVGVSNTCHDWVLWDPELNELKRAALVVFDETAVPRNAADSNVLDSVLSSIRINHLGDFLHIKDLEIQDACLDSMTTMSSFKLDAPNTYHQALKTEDCDQWADACKAEVDMMISVSLCDAKG